MGLDKPVWSYKVIHSLWLPLLGLGVHGKDQAVQKASFYQHWAWRQVSKSPKAPEDCPLPICCLLGSFTERATVVLELHKVGSSWIPR